jgi:hypothetical protein
MSRIVQWENENGRRRYYATGAAPDIAQVCLRLLALEQSAKPGLVKMMVGSQGIANSQLAHDDKTGAIRKGVIVIDVFAEKRFGREKSLRVDPLRSKPRRSLEELKEAVSHDAAPPRDSKVERFSDDVITRYNHPPGLCQLPHEQRRIEMMSIPCVNSRVQRRSIGKRLAMTMRSPFSTLATNCDRRVFAAWTLTTVCDIWQT